ncbi:MAG: hypothetical protein R3195_07140 [Gemmatimonadota bacterium]|nr:hypothetical protein [Gemmatimonadota bacterium]
MLRRRGARRRVREVRPRRVLVMCLGNICRSPYVEGVLRRDAPELDVRSAGFLESGRPAPREAVSVAAEHGVNLTAHRSSQITPDMLRWADLVLVMDGKQAMRVESLEGGVLVERLGDFDPGRIDTRTVIDPIDRDRDFFDRIYTRLDACCRALVQALRETS